MMVVCACKTTHNQNITNLSAVSDKDYKLSLIKSSNFTPTTSDSEASQNHQFFEFLVCSTSNNDNCVNAFKSDDGSGLAFNIIDFDRVLSRLSLTQSEFDQIKNQMINDGFISDIQKAQITSSQLQGAVGVGLGASSAMIVHDLSVLNIDTLNSRITAFDRINEIDNILFVTSQLKFKRTYPDNSQKTLAALNKSYLNALNTSYQNSQELSELFLKRDSDFADVFEEVSSVFKKETINKNLPKPSDELIEFYSKQALEVDQVFLSQLQTKLTTMQSNARSLSYQNNKTRDFYLNTYETLSNLNKKITQAVSTDGKINTKLIFAALSDYYAKVIDHNDRLITGLQSELDIQFFVAYKKLFSSSKKTIAGAKMSLAAHADVLNKWYSRPLFQGSQIDALGRKIDTAAIKNSAQGIKTIKNTTSDIANNIKRAGQSTADQIYAQASKVTRKRLAKPLMIIIGLALGGGVVLNGVKVTPQSTEKTLPRDPNSQQGSSQIAYDHGQFYMHLQHALTTDNTINQPINSVDHFIENLAKFLNTNVLRSQESEITIQSICFPTSTLGQESCKTVSS